MTINITLIFQAVNFFIAYILLRFLLFKPAYEIIQKEHREREGLQNGISHQRSILMRKEQDIKDRWRECQDHFSKNRPLIETPELYIFKHIAPSIERSHIASQTVTKLIKDVQQALVEKVG